MRIQPFTFLEENHSLKNCFIFWNFVSSSKETLEEAKHKWEAQEFPKIPGETEYVPLPKPKL